MEENQKPVGWNWLDLLICYVGALLAQFFILSFSLEPLKNLSARYGLELMSVQFLYSIALQCTLMLMFTAVIIIGIRKRRWRDIGFIQIPLSAWLRYGLAGGLGLAGVMVLFSYIMTWLIPEAKEQGIELALRQASGGLAYGSLILAACVLAPFYEELFFRGLLYAYLRNLTSAPAAMILSGSIFALIHGDLWRFVPITAGGVCLAYLFEKSGSIWTSILAHSLWNAVMVIAVLTT